MNTYAIIFLSIACGLLLLAAVMYLAGFISKQSVSYFSAPLIIFLITLALGGFVYQSALKKQFYIEVSYNNKPLSGFSMAADIEYADKDDYYLFKPENNSRSQTTSEPIKFSELIDELSLSDKFEICKSYAQHQTNNTLNKNNVYRVCVNKKGLW